MKKSIFTAALLLIAGAMFTSCNKDHQQIFHLSINDPQAKTSLGADYFTYWQSNDQILINTTPLTVTVDNERAWTSSAQTIDPVNGQFYAFYAGDCTDVTADVTDAAQSYSFTMPSSYTYNPANLHSPMAGTGTYQGSNPATSVLVSFDNLFALLELEVPIAPNGSSYTITITETETSNNPLSGDFAATYNGTSWTTTCTGNSGNTLTISNSSSEGKIYVPIPAGAHKLNIAFGSMPGGAQQIQSYNFQAGFYYQINAMPGTPAGGEVVPFPFPTDDGGYAFFGKGNMVFDVDQNPQWHLEPNQWDYTEFQVSGNTASHSSSLSWMTSQNQNPENPNNGGTVHGALYPEGYAYLLNDNVHTSNWSVPSQAEWTSFLGLGTGNTARWAYLKINTGSTTVNGLFFTPTALSEMPSTLEFGQTYASGWSNVPTMSTSDFETLERMGCIFLPAYGYVVHQGNLGHIESSSVNDGYYRTATATQTATASVLYFTPTADPSSWNCIVAMV